jgi:hypothetical protein
LIGTGSIYAITPVDEQIAMAMVNQSHQAPLSAYELLFREHFLKLIPFTLRTPFGDMENMLFRSFTVIRDQSTKHAIVFSAEMVQLQMVVPDSASIEPVAEADLIGDQAQTQAVGETDLGDVSLQEIP